jgi:hypothetical protein
MRNISYRAEDIAIATIPSGIVYRILSPVGTTIVVVGSDNGVCRSNYISCKIVFLLKTIEIIPRGQGHQLKHPRD